MFRQVLNVSGGSMSLNAISLEEALTKTDTDAEAALKAAKAAIRSLNKFRAAAHTGDLRELRRTIDTAEQSMTALRQQFANAKEGWDFDEESYLTSGDFTKELLQTAKKTGVRIFEDGDRLYCYPHLIRILPADRAVLIDKARYRHLRPTFLVGHLKDLQSKPVRFRPEAFLESLWAAYDIAARTRGSKDTHAGAVIPLVDIYDLLTLLPGQSKEYSLQEFARDIYLLDKSGVNRTKKGLTFTWPASTAMRSTGRTISVITQEGRDQKYYGIAFASS